MHALLRSWLPRGASSTPPSPPSHVAPLLLLLRFLLPALALLGLLDLLLGFSFPLPWLLLLLLPLWLLSSKDAVPDKSQAAQAAALVAYAKQMALLEQSSTSPESAAWLNRLLLLLWPNAGHLFLLHVIKSRLQACLDRETPPSVERVEILEMDLGSASPEVEAAGLRWSSDGDGRSFLSASLSWQSVAARVEVAVRGAVGGAKGSIKAAVTSFALKGTVRAFPLPDSAALLWTFVDVPSVTLTTELGLGGSDSSSSFAQFPVFSSWLEASVSSFLAQTCVLPYQQLLLLPLPPPLSLTPPSSTFSASLSVAVLSASSLSKPLLPSPSTSATAATTTAQQQQQQQQQQAVVGPCVAEVECGSIIRQTKMSVKGGPSVDWAEEFVLSVRGGECVVVVRIIQVDKGGSDCTIVGTAVINIRRASASSSYLWSIGPHGTPVLHEAAGSHPLLLTLPLQHAAGGEITVKIAVREWKEIQDTSPPPADQSLASSQATPSAVSPPLALTPSLPPTLSPPAWGTVRVTVLEGRGLFGPHDVSTSNGTLSAAVSLQLGQALFNTRSISDPNPVWNEAFDLTVDATSASQGGGSTLLTIRCSAYSGLWSRASLGDTRLNLEALKGRDESTLWVPLGNGGKGDIKLSFQFADVASSNRLQRTSSLESNQSTASAATSSALVPASIAASKNILSVVVVAAKGLKGGGRRPDVYASIRYGSIKRRTKVLHHTVDPIWNESFEFEEGRHALTIVLKDFHGGGFLPSYSLGHCSIAYLSLPLNVPQTIWAVLEGQASVQLQVIVTRKHPSAPSPPRPSSSSASEAGPLSSSHAASSVAPPVPPLPDRRQKNVNKSMQKVQEALDKALASTAAAAGAEGERSGGSGDEKDAALHELERAVEKQQQEMSDLLKDRDLLLRKVKELETEMTRFLGL